MFLSFFYWRWKKLLSNNCDLPVICINLMKYRISRWLEYVFQSGDFNLLWLYLKWWYFTFFFNFFFQLGAWRQELNNWWNNLHPGHKVITPIFAANLLVFFMWRVPALQPFMMRYFMASPSARAGTCLPMLLSAFR